MKKVFIVTICIFVLVVASSYAMSSKEQKNGYQLVKKYCNSCHDSVADPEKRGFTRDTWHLILNNMHKHGLEKLSTEESGSLVDYLYAIRKGMEREAG